MRAARHVAAGAFVAMSASFAWWNWQAFADPAKLLLVLPLLLTCPFVFGRRVRPLVVAATLSLPYLCFALVEIVAANAARIAPIMAVACGVVFLALLPGVTRHAKREALARVRRRGE